MITVEYREQGAPISDWGLDYIIDNVIIKEEFNDVNVSYSTENIFLAIRTAVVTGRLNHKSIQFKFNDKIIDIYEDGKLSEFPTGFLDVADNLLTTLLGWDK